VGHYLDAAYTASGLMSGSTGNEATDARLTYNNACQEMTVLLRSSDQLWNRTTTIQGGLVIQMQAVSSDRVLWNGVFQNDADHLYATIPSDNVTKKALIFDANPHVKRLVFICVPHRGSYLASNWIGSIGVSLIRIPRTIVSHIGEGITGSLLKNIGLKHMPTGINGLSPRNPVLRSLDTLPIAVPYYSIIGDRGRGDTPNSSDGVVPYWGSHMAGAQLELIVPGPRGSFALPQTIAELKRILRLHLATLSRSDSSDTAKKSHSARGPAVRRLPPMGQAFASYCPSLRR
jgi:hypothetical protein